MGLFRFRKKKQKETPCGCSCCAKPVEENQVVQGDEVQGEAVAREDVETEHSETEYVNTEYAEAEDAQIEVKVLGSGCSKCNELERATREALKQLGISIEIEHVTDFGEIAAYGVMTTPALVVNGNVVSYGKVLKTEEVIALLEKHL